VAAGRVIQPCGRRVGDTWPAVFRLPVCSNAALQHRISVND